MSSQWMINTHGDPLGTVRDFVKTVWQTLDLKHMLVPLNGQIDETGPRLIDEPDELSSLNPFAPLMPLNAAKFIPEILARDSSQIGAMLRPCEMRTLIEMGKHNGFSTQNLLTISVDCLGTLPIDEYQWRAERKGSPKDLTQEALQFSRQGGIVRYRYRSACQVCISPQATTADINIGILGLPVRQQILITIDDENLTERLDLAKMANTEIDPELLEGHQRVASRLVARSINTRDRITNGLAEVLPENIEALINQFESCGDCSTCLNVCPLCDIHYPQRDAEGRYKESEIVRWLISCSGCGICDQSCPQHLPLTIIFNHIQAQLANDYNYQAGFSANESLPIL
jgi:formate dehydrogenase subunit beta